MSEGYVREHEHSTYEYRGNCLFRPISAGKMRNGRRDQNDEEARKGPLFHEIGERKNKNDGACKLEYRKLDAEVGVKAEVPEPLFEASIEQVHHAGCSHHERKERDGNPVETAEHLHRH